MFIAHATAKTKTNLDICNVGYTKVTFFDIKCFVGATSKVTARHGILRPWHLYMQQGTVSVGTAQIVCLP